MFLSTEQQRWARAATTSGNDKNASSAVLISESHDLIHLSHQLITRARAIAERSRKLASRFEARRKTAATGDLLSPARQEAEQLTSL